MKWRTPPSIEVVVAGYLGVDLTPGFPTGLQNASIERFLRPGALIETRGLGISLGGVVANTGLALRHFGRRVELMGCVGDDTLGEIVMDLLRAKGVKRGIRRSKRAGTAYGIVLATEGMDRIFLEDPGCNAVFTADDIDYKIVRQSRLFHFGYPPLMRSLWLRHGTELRRILARVHKSGVAISMDMALPDPVSPAGKADWREVLCHVLPYVDVFAPSIEELFFMLEPELYGRISRRLRGRDMVDEISRGVFERLADRVLAAGVKVLMIKAGAKGAYVRTGDVALLQSTLAIDIPVANWSHRSLWIAPFRVDRRRFRNACGAGDCAVAGFLSALLSGSSIERAARYAMLAGRDNLYGFDACSGLRDWKSMTEFLNRCPSGGEPESITRPVPAEHSPSRVSASASFR